MLLMLVYKLRHIKYCTCDEFYMKNIISHFKIRGKWKTNKNY